MPTQEDLICEIVTIGDELCRGEIVDTNSAWLAVRLWELGLPVAWMTSCRDVAGDLAQALRTASERAGLVLVSGGLGPTEDDLTVDVVASLAGGTPEPHAPSLEKMQARFARAKFEVTPNNLRQVRVPAGATAWLNSAGMAPGFEVALGARRTPTMVFPGVPREMKALWQDHAEARVRQLSQGALRLATRIYRVFGAGESHIDHRLAGLTSGHSGATIHFQVTYPETLVKLVVRAADGAAAQAALAAMDQELRARLGALVYSDSGSFPDDSLAAALGRKLAARGLRLAVAESCTGGMLGGLITDVPGSSAWFVGGHLVYDNALKVALGVPEVLLAAHGAVSRECVESLAEAIRRRTGADLGVAISGVAGPGGGSADKPVGTVHVAVAGPALGSGLVHKAYQFAGARDQVRRLASYWAMRLVLDAAGP
jgi:nicotinamide-nucleotide amidase